MSSIPNPRGGERVILILVWWFLCVCGYRYEFTLKSCEYKELRENLVVTTRMTTPQEWALRVEFR
jgi:hypothetical protein